MNPKYCFVSSFCLVALVLLRPGAAEVHSSAQGNQLCQCNNCCGTSLDPGRPRKPQRKVPGDVNRAGCPPRRYQRIDHTRAGEPHFVASWATCSVSEKYSGYFVGGGAAFSHVPQTQLALLGRGRNRKANGCGQHGEGTWGLDYDGFFGKANIWLKYTQGRRQGGEGAYETDGEPKFVSKLKKALGHH